LVVVKTETDTSSAVISWSEEDMEVIKTCLRNSGRNWAVMSLKLNGAMTPEQSKKFFYNNRKKYQLDKLVVEFKRSHQTGDQPPTLSSDEESGSSTSSCDEEAGMSSMQNNATASGNSSPSRRPNNSDNSNKTTSSGGVGGGGRLLSAAAYCIGLVIKGRGV
jgi:hypothetical protein